MEGSLVSTMSQPTAVVPKLVRAFTQIKVAIMCYYPQYFAVIAHNIMAVVTSQGQIFTEANMLIPSPVSCVVQCILWRPNLLPLFNLGW